VFDPALIDEQVLIVAATSDAAVNRQVADAARAAHRLCNVVDDGATSTFIVPAVVDRSPVIVAVGSGGQAPVLARIIRQRLEQWLPARLGRLAAWAGGWRARVRKRLPDIDARRAAWEKLLTGPAAAAVLRGDEREADECAGALLDDPGATSRTGCAWLVGAGPGDPALISVRGLQAIEQADVILHDRLVHPELLRAARREAEIICVGKTGHGPSTSQDDINALLLSRVGAGRRVCRLKGGDPFVFGRGGEEALALAQAGMPFEVVPGITAANGCGAAARIPLTHRGVATAVTLVTAQATPGATEPDWRALAALGQTLVVYMGGRRIAVIADELVRHGRSSATPAAVIVAGTGASEQVISGTLADIGARASACAPAASPSLLIVGETVALADLLSGQAQADQAECTASLARAPAALVG
jgi:uroporphyrin-III C-methyltransferase/precorrin-2 dehydrogenase/sirohydrochlorin ferrochelatase